MQSVIRLQLLDYIGPIKSQLLNIKIICADSWKNTRKYVHKLFERRRFLESALFKPILHQNNYYKLEIFSVKELNFVLDKIH